MNSEKGAIFTAGLTIVFLMPTLRVPQATRTLTHLGDKGHKAERFLEMLYIGCASVSHITFGLEICQRRDR